MALLYLFVFATVVGTVMFAYNRFIVAPEQALIDRLTPKPKRVAAVKSAASDKIRKEQRPTTGLNAAVGRITPLMEPVQALLQQAGSKQHADEFLLLSAGLGTVGVLLASLVVGWKAGVPIGIFVALIPTLLVRRQRTVRLNRFEELFPGALGLVSRALRAGHALPTGLKMVAEEAQQPVGGEFRVIFEEQNFGLTLPEALRNFAKRVPLLDARFFVVAVLIQRESGGNLSEVLDNLSAIIRERFKVKREIRTKSAYGKMTGMIIGLLPVVLFALNGALSGGDTVRALTGTSLGITMLEVGLGLQILGALVIRNIVNIEY